MAYNLGRDWPFVCTPKTALTCHRPSLLATIRSGMNNPNHRSPDQNISLLRMSQLITELLTAHRLSLIDLPSYVFLRITFTPRLFERDKGDPIHKDGDNQGRYNP